MARGINKVIIVGILGRSDTKSMPVEIWLLILVLRHLNHGMMRYWRKTREDGGHGVFGRLAEIADYYLKRIPSLCRRQAAN